MFKGKGLNSVFPILIASLFFAGLATAQEWVSRAPMPTARLDLAAGAINGILYAVGGWSGGPNCNGSPTPPDMRLGQTTSPDMRATVEAYDPAANTWTAKAPMPRARRELAVGVVNGILYAVGGETDPGTSLNTVEAYDPSSNTWTSRAPMLTARRELAAGVVNGILYAVGGHSGGSQDSIYHTTLEAYDPATNTWTAKAPMPTARNLLAVGVVNGILYAAGGTNGSAALATVEAYDPATNTWTTKASMPTLRGAFGAGAINGILHTVGPGGADQPNTLYAANTSYDPATDTWTINSPMPTARQELAIGVVNDVLYALGGCPYAFPDPLMNAGAGLTKVEAYTPPAYSFTGTPSGSNSSLSLLANLTIAPADVGRTGSIYIAARLASGELFFLTPAGFTGYTGGPLPTYDTGTLSNRSISVLSGVNVTPFLGTTVYAGYGRDEADLVGNSKYSVIHTVR